MQLIYKALLQVPGAGTYLLNAGFGHNLPGSTSIVGKYALAPTLCLAVRLCYATQL